MEKQKKVFVSVAILVLLLLLFAGVVYKKYMRISIDALSENSQNVDEQVIVPDDAVSEKVQENGAPVFSFVAPSGERVMGNATDGVKMETPEYMIRIMVQQVADGFSWKEWVRRGGPAMGNSPSWTERVIGQYDVVQLTDAVKKGDTSFDAYVYTEAYTSIALSIPNGTQDMVAEVSLRTQTDSLEQHLPIIEEIVKTFIWEE